MKKLLTTLNDQRGEEVTVSGWVKNIREHSKVAFIDLRDSSGTLQVVIEEDLIPTLKELGAEFLIEVTGAVKERGEKQKRSDESMGEIELLANKITVISPSLTPPFQLDEDTSSVGEDVRLPKRYLDLRTERLQKNIKKRHDALLFLRNYYSGEGFLEIETPQLTKGTPEGAREFFVPSRKEIGKAYVLPQSPQQYKQLLMVGGFDRYIQVARCFRDEDKRADRQPEFTQLDIEASFVTQEDILNLIENSMVEMVQKVFPGKEMTSLPFPRITYTEAIEKYKSDKPDIRENKEDGGELGFLWVVDFPMFEKDEETGKINAAHHPFTMPQDEDLERKSEEELLSVPAYSYDLVLNGFELGSGSIRVHQQDLQRKIFSVLGLPDDEIQSRFGHMLEAFSYSPPPHGGFAIGIDRLLAVLLNEDNIREVIAFPKTGEGKELVTGAPAEISAQTLTETGIRFEK